MDAGLYIYLNSAPKTQWVAEAWKSSSWPKVTFRLCGFVVWSIAVQRMCPEFILCSERARAHAYTIYPRHFKINPHLYHDTFRYDWTGYWTPIRRWVVVNSFVHYTEVPDSNPLQGRVRYFRWIVEWFSRILHWLRARVIIEVYFKNQLQTKSPLRIGSHPIHWPHSSPQGRPHSLWSRWAPTGTRHIARCTANGWSALSRPATTPVPRAPRSSTAWWGEWSGRNRLPLWFCIAEVAVEQGYNEWSTKPLRLLFW